MPSEFAVSRTKIKGRISNKTNSALAETIRLALNNSAWKKIAQILSNSTREYSSVNLKEIDALAKEGDTILIPGKVLASGDISKKVRICSLSISASAREKLKRTKSEYASIAEEIKINKKAEGVKVIQ